MSLVRINSENDNLFSIIYYYLYYRTFWFYLQSVWLSHILANLDAANKSNSHVGHFRWPKITFDRISRIDRIARSIRKMAAAAVLDPDFCKNIFDTKTLLSFDFDFIEYFTTTFLRAHFWLNWVGRPSWEVSINHNCTVCTVYITFVHLLVVLLWKIHIP